MTDTFSGIRSVEWTVESPYDKENNQSGNVEISNQGAFSSGNADGWSQTKKDKNLVTELKKSFTVKNNSNEIKNAYQNDRPCRKYIRRRTDIQY